GAIIAESRRFSLRPSAASGAGAFRAGFVWLITASLQNECSMDIPAIPVPAPPDVVWTVGVAVGSVRGRRRSGRGARGGCRDGGRRGGVGSGGGRGRRAEGCGSVCPRLDLDLPVADARLEAGLRVGRGVQDREAEQRVAAARAARAAPALPERDGVEEQRRDVEQRVDDAKPPWLVVGVLPVGQARRGRTRRAGDAEGDRGVGADAQLLALA